MTWIDEDVHLFVAGVEAKTGVKLDAIFRKEFAKHARQDCATQFCETVSLALHMIHTNRKQFADEDGKAIAMSNRAHEIREAAKALNSALAAIGKNETDDDPSQEHILEGRINGTGLVKFSQECTARLIQRCDTVLDFHGKDRGGQSRSADIAGVLMIASAWRDHTGKEPRAKGTFGAFLNSVLSEIGWSEIAPNTLQSWMNSQ